MSKLKYSKTSWHARFYNSHYGEWKLPNNICPYFWKLVLALVLLPVTFFGHIVNAYNKNYELEAQNWFMFGVFSWVGTALLVLLTPVKFPLLAFVISAIVFALALYGIIQLSEWGDARKRRKRDLRWKREQEAEEEYARLGGRAELGEAFDDWYYFKLHGRKRGAQKTPWYAPLWDGIVNWYERKCTPIDWS